MGLLKLGKHYIPVEQQKCPKENQTRKRKKREDKTAGGCNINLASVHDSSPLSHNMIH
jgi:hypothetical protein